MSYCKVITKKLVPKSIEFKSRTVTDHGNFTISNIVDNLGYAEWQITSQDGFLITLQPQKIKKDFTLKKVDLKYCYPNRSSTKYSVSSTTIDAEKKIFSGNKQNRLNGYNLYFECSMEILVLEEIESEHQHLKLLIDYEKILKDDIFSDLTIKTNSGNKIWKGHKAILAARSPVFAAMLSTDMKEKKTNEVEISDVDPDVLVEMLSFIYCGKISDYGKYYDLFVAADKYQIEDLLNFTYEYVLRNINAKTIINCLKIAENYDKQELRKAAIEFIIRNYDEMKPVIETKEWFDLISQYPALMKDIMVAFYQKKCEECCLIMRLSCLSTEQL